MHATYTNTSLPRLFITKQLTADNDAAAITVSEKTAVSKFGGEL